MLTQSGAFVQNKAPVAQKRFSPKMPGESESRRHSQTPTHLGLVPAGAACIPMLPSTGRDCSSATEGQQQLRRLIAPLKDYGVLRPYRIGRPCDSLQVPDNRSLACKPLVRLRAHTDAVEALQVFSAV